MGAFSLIRIKGVFASVFTNLLSSVIMPELAPGIHCFSPSQTPR